MKRISLILWAAIFLPILSFAEDFSLSDGREFKDVTVTRVLPDGIMVMTDEGVIKLPFNLLPPDVQQAFRNKPTASPTPADFQPDSQLPISEDLKKQTAQPIATPKTATATQSLQPETQQPFAPGAEHPRPPLMGALHCLIPLVGLLVAWLLGRNLIANWTCKQKQRELEFDLVRKFHTAYEDFFAVWKLWNHQRDQGDHNLPDHGEFEPQEVSRAELLHTVGNAEGSIEAILVTLASTRDLSQTEVELLGRFHQAFGTLRDAISKNKQLAWNDPEHAEYLAFKRLASGVVMLIHGSNPASPVAQKRIESLRQITSSRWEKTWSQPGA
jgi:hypothetical protein